MEAPREGNGERNAVKVARCVRRGEHAPAHEVGRFLPYLVGVTPHQGARESRAQGEVAQVVGCPGAVRYARCGTPKQEWVLFERCSKEATGELLEIERLTSSLERGHGKSTREGNSLVAYSTARTVLTGGMGRRTDGQRASFLPTMPPLPRAHLIFIHADLVF